MKKSLHRNANDGICADTPMPKTPQQKAASILGSMKSEKKTAAARANALKGWKKRKRDAMTGEQKEEEFQNRMRECTEPPQVFRTLGGTIVDRKGKKK